MGSGAGGLSLRLAIVAVIAFAGALALETALWPVVLEGFGRQTRSGLVVAPAWLRLFGLLLPFLALSLAAVASTVGVAAILRGAPRTASALFGTTVGLAVLLAAAYWYLFPAL